MTKEYIVKTKKYGVCKLILLKRHTEYVLKLNNIDGAWKDENDPLDNTSIFHISNHFTGKRVPNYPNVSNYTLADVAIIVRKLGAPLGDVLRIAKRQL